jgi:NAD dependent epimerase/dehydratase
MEVVAGDVREIDSVRRAMEGCRSVFHLAALIGIPYSYISPLAYVRTNVEGTYNVLESARLLDLDRVLIASTSEIYGTAQYAPIDEKHPAVGQSPYAASKIAADALAMSYYYSFGLPVTIVRPFNTYGPRQSARAIVPTIAAQVLAGAEKIRLGNLEPTRDLTYVRDTAAGFLAAASSDSLVGEAVNIGVNDEISIGDLAQKIIALAGSRAAVEVDPQRQRAEASEVVRLRCDHTKIRQATGWAPAYDLDRGLRETIDWIGRNMKTYKPNVYTI